MLTGCGHCWVPLSDKELKTQATDRRQREFLQGDTWTSLITVKPSVGINPNHEYISEFSIFFLGTITPADELENLKT